MNNRRLNVLASIGLAVGGVLGMTGTFAPSAALRGLAWGIDGAALVMAGGILTVVFYRTGQDLVAAGFLVFAIGEGTILSSAAMDLDASVPSFAAGSILWAMALVLISLPPVFPSGANAGADHGEYVRIDSAANLLRRASDPPLVPFAILRLSLLRCHIRRLDLDAFEGSRPTPPREMTSGPL